MLDGDNSPKTTMIITLVLTVICMLFILFDNSFWFSILFDNSFWFNWVCYLILFVTMLAASVINVIQSINLKLSAKSIIFTGITHIISIGCLAWLIVLNRIYAKKLAAKKAPKEYYSTSNLYIFLLFLQFYLIFAYYANKGSPTAYQFIVLLFILNMFQIMLVGIIQVILQLFSTLKRFPTI